MNDQEWYIMKAIFKNLVVYIYINEKLGLTCEHGAYSLL